MKTNKKQFDVNPDGDMDKVSAFLEDISRIEGSEWGEYLEGLAYLWRNEWQFPDNFRLVVADEMRGQARYIKENYQLETKTLSTPRDVESLVKK